MASYMQMGHNTENLVGETDLKGFSGVVLSPMNREFDRLLEDVQKFRSRGVKEIIFDPQLYYPNTERLKLRSHKYFPDDLETADLSNITWWQRINDVLIEYRQILKLNTISSPAIEPRLWDDDYYFTMTQVADDLKAKIGKKTACLATVMVSTREISQENIPLRIASLVSNTICDGYYVVFVSDLEPRREFYDPIELIGMLSFVTELKRTGKQVWISFCGSEMIMFKCAGADHCCTGKYFNLRRFTKSRYEEPSGGGGQLPYWFEHSLMAFLRESDILRLTQEDKNNFLEVMYSGNHWSKEILGHLDTGSGRPWLSLSWRQYLSWFWQTELDLASNPMGLVSNWLKEAESNWLTLEDEDILLEEPRNNGSWVRPWRQALSRLKKLNY